MSLQHGILGLLTYRESTGYDLARIFEDSLNNFWHAQSSQIYRELGRMEEKAWVSSRSVIQEGRPNKRLYAITESGRVELMRWLAEAEPSFENSHHAMLMRLFFGADDPAAALSLLKACRDRCKTALEACRAPIENNIAAYAASMAGGQEKSKYWAMTLDYGICQTEATIAWAERCIAQLEGETEK